MLNGLPWKWREIIVIFEVAPKYCILDSLVDYESYSISSMVFLPTVIDTMVIWISPIPVHFDSLIPRMSMFILIISCLTRSSLPWFVDLTFQVPKQYCSLQHRILLLLPDTTTAEHQIRFSPAASFTLGRLVLLLCSSPVAYWTPSDLRGLIFWGHIFLAFYTVYEVLTASILGQFAMSSCSDHVLSWFR